MLVYIYNAMSNVNVLCIYYICIVYADVAYYNVVHCET